MVTIQIYMKMDNSSFPIIAQNVCQNKQMGWCFALTSSFGSFPIYAEPIMGWRSVWGGDCMFCHTTSQYPIYQKKNQTLEHIPSMKTTFACSISEIVCFLHICLHTSSMSLLRIQLGTSFLLTYQQCLTIVQEDDRQDTV